MYSITNTAPSIVGEITVSDALSNATSHMITFDKKGNPRCFEMSISFASKDERQRLMMEIFAKQCMDGNYGNLMREVLNEGIVPKAQRLVIDMMLGQARRPSKATARSFCMIIEGLHALAVSNGKAPKGKKMVLISMVAELSALIGKDDTAKDDAARTIEG
jgi:hypothetical protein